MLIKLIISVFMVFTCLESVRIIGSEMKQKFSSYAINNIYYLINIRI